MGLFGRDQWPPAAARDVWRDIASLSSLANSDILAIRDMANRSGMGVKSNQAYLNLPLADVISSASAAMLVGEEPHFRSQDEADQDLMQHIVNENGLPAELHHGTKLASTEGEFWFRLYIDEDLLDAPIIEVISRGQVIPRFRGRFLVGATVVQEWREGTDTYWRLLEDHEAGLVTHELYLGTRSALGKRQPLSAFKNTESLEDEWETKVKRPLVIPCWNAIGKDRTRGISDLVAVKHLLLAANETMTVGQHNLRLTGRKRLAVPRALTEDKKGKPAWDLTDDVLAYGEGASPFPQKSTGAPAVSKPAQAITTLEYGFEAKEIIAWCDQVLDLALTMAGISPQSVGRGIEGTATSGTAMRLRMAYSLAQANAKGRHLDRAVSEAMSLAQQLDATHFGRDWTDPETAPSMTRGDGLPEDTVELAREIGLLAAADAISDEEKVRRQHPNWNDEKVSDEVARIQSGKPAPLVGLP